jgi:hypothetical protein
MPGATRSGTRKRKGAAPAAPFFVFAAAGLLQCRATVLRRMWARRCARPCTSYACYSFFDKATLVVAGRNPETCVTIDWIGIAGVLLGVAGVAISLVQTYRYEEARERLIRIKRARNATIWHNIALVLNAYESLEDAREFSSQQDLNASRDALQGKIASARRSVIDQYLDLLKEAVLDEEHFSEDTIEYWKSIGRLDNEWRVKQAKKFLQKPETRTTQNRNDDKATRAD